MAIIIVFGVACKKDNPSFSTSTSVLVVNAAVNVTGIKVNPNNLIPINYSTSSQVAYGASAFYFTQRAGASLTIVSAADTTINLLSTPISSPSGISTIYIGGQIGAIDTIIREETSYPFIDNGPTSTDSSVNIRFVNLSPNSKPVNINIKGSTGNETSNLSYKAITDFKKYPALVANASYIFEVRDVTTNALLFSYTLPISTTNRFKNMAVILKGLAGTTTGTNAFGAFTVNYF